MLDPVVMSGTQQLISQTQPIDPTEAAAATLALPDGTMTSTLMLASASSEDPGTHLLHTQQQSTSQSGLLLSSSPTQIAFFGPRRRKKAARQETKEVG